MHAQLPTLCHHTLTLLLMHYRPDVAYYVSGFGPAEQQVTALVIWVPLQLAAFGVYPAFKVCCPIPSDRASFNKHLLL